MANARDDLPQGGTGGNADGESSAGLSRPVCPSYSGGGNIRHESQGGSSPFKDVEGAGSGSESASSMISVGSVTVDDSAGKFYRKRTRQSGGETAPNSSDDELRPASQSGRNTPKRGRGRPPTTGEYVGLSKAKAALNAEKERELKLRAEEELVDSIQRAATSEASLKKLVSVPVVLDDKTTLTIKQSADQSIAMIQMVAAKSGNLKGAYQGALNKSAALLKKVVEVLSVRSTSDETALLQAECARLQADNARMQREMLDLRKEFTDLRAEAVLQRAAPAIPAVEAQPVQPQPYSEELVRSIMVQLGTMMDARFEEYEGRHLPEKRQRPPLAADTRKGAAPMPEEVQMPASKKSAPPTKGKKKPKVADTPVRPSAETTVPEPTAGTSSTEEGWTTVVKGKKKQKEKKPAASKTPKSAGPKKAEKETIKRSKRLRTPRTTAVVITLQPGAKERGLTYASILMEARDKVPLADLGITKLTYREAVTGARIFELPGATSGEKADVLAQRFREALNAEDVRVSRPVKTAELRVSGLDDSVTSEEVAAAVARTGGCSAAEVKVGEVRFTASRQGGSAWVRCPVAVANKVSQSRLLVGWVSAQVRLLKTRPTRCFRCLLQGHIQHFCKEVDRRTQCYRCGEVGHLAKQCTKTPHCTYCATAGHPADHPIGTKPCRANKVAKKGKGKAAAPQPTPATVANTGEEVVVMSD